MKRIRKIIRESVRQVLSESKNLSVSDFKYDDELENILDISNYVIKKVAYDLWPKLNFTEEQKEEIGGITSDFTPDGHDAFEPTGVMNFYVGGWPVDSIEKVVGYIKYILNERDIKVGDVKYEKVKDKISAKDFAEWGITDGGESLRVVRIPIVENNSGDSGNPPDVDFSNTYAHKIFGEILGFQNDDGFYDMDAADLLMKVDSARKEMSTRKDIPDTAQQAHQGNILSTINGKDYYYRKFDEISKLAKWALDRGYRRLHVA